MMTVGPSWHITQMDDLRPLMSLVQDLGLRRGGQARRRGLFQDARLMNPAGSVRIIPR
ncbi:MAG: hypothetical protein AVDCRST_MAG02-4743 [uncultured Rubrobacteraceae bacterium]|uniref:Uncharacterized protein n=1 Tax=uncultured Rubrobacteraceae bacterium TaxID=349277 RepID=A0A6J4RUT3_9ACTN|nr:MAG: hypothetical protein AVDCRST_MAG02-4743 [uncultured Rubrobacteraceae bacterium]